RIRVAGGGLTTISTDASVSLDFIVFAYRYEFHGREDWQADQITSVDDRAVDGDKSLVLRARVDARGSTIEASGKPATSGPIIAMTTNYWHAPAGSRGSTLVLLDADQGSLYHDRIDDIISEQLSFNGSTAHCLHYVLRGDSSADLWFDDEGRLIRQETVE